MCDVYTRHYNSSAVDIFLSVASVLFHDTAISFQFCWWVTCCFTKFHFA